MVLDREEGRRLGVALGSHKAVILRNHGMLTVGASVDSAAWWFLAVERTAQCQLTAYAAAAGHGRPPRWFQFQPIWERISRAEPDLFD